MAKDLSDMSLKELRAEVRRVEAELKADKEAAAREAEVRRKRREADKERRERELRASDAGFASSTQQGGGDVRPLFPKRRRPSWK